MPVLPRLTGRSVVIRRNARAAARRLHTAGAAAAARTTTMLKLLAAAYVALSLIACSSMSSTGTMGNRAETKNSTDANKSGNPAAVSPGTGSAPGSAAK
jgi:hypothetical protein